MDISLLILTHNRKEYLQQTLTSICQQKTGGICFEVVIIDDGSSDGTKRIVQEFSDKIENLVYVYHEHDGVNIAKCRNQALGNSHGQIVCFIDSGVVLREDFIKQHCRMHQGENVPDVVIGRVIGFEVCLGDSLFVENYNPNEIQESISRISGIEHFEDRRMASYHYFKDSFQNMPTPWHYFWTCNVSWKRIGKWKEVWFDEKISSWGMEDVELGYRLKKMGAAFEYNTEAVALHVPHDTHEDVERKASQDNENLMYFYRKHKCSETEMYAYGRMYTHNEIVQNFLERTKKRIRNEKIVDIGIELHNAIILGGGGLQIKGLSIKPVIVDYEEKFSKIKEENYRAGLGADIQSADNAFDEVIIWDYWSYISNTLLWSVLKESVRVGKYVYVLVEMKDNNNESLFHVQEEKKIELCNILLVYGRKYKEITITLSGGERLQYIQTI